MKWSKEEKIIAANIDKKYKYIFKDYNGRLYIYPDNRRRIHMPVEQTKIDGNKLFTRIEEDTFVCIDDIINGEESLISNELWKYLHDFIKMSKLKNINHIEFYNGKILIKTKNDQFTIPLITPLDSAIAQHHSYRLKELDL